MNDSVVAEIVRNQRRLEGKRWLIVLMFLIIAAVSFLFDIATGPAMTDTLPVGEVVNVLLGKPEVDEMNRLIVMDLRLPIAVMALVVGAALGVGGAEIQTLLNNPMASPYTLGLAAAAGLGASVVIAFGGFGLPETVAVPIGAFVMTMLASGILFLFQSILSLIQFIAAPEISQQILFWLFGSLNKATWETVIVTAAVTAVCVLLLSRDVWKLTALRLGEERAVGLGINLQLLRLKTLVLVAVMTATAISFVGVIGFIGLVAPHVARILLGEDQRFFLPGAMLTGAAFLSVASVLSKVIIPGALFPVGIVTAFVGVPFFFWIVLSKR